MECGIKGKMRVIDCPCDCHRRGFWFCDKCDTVKKVLILQNDSKIPAQYFIDEIKEEQK